MSEQLRLERHLPGLLEDLYLTGSPDYRNDVLAAVARTRQRPAWTFPGRWLPMADIAARSAFVPRVPLRALVVLALLIALAVAAIAYVGSQQRRLPPPFGPARNGLLVYSADGDLFTADPTTGESRPLVASADVERHPLVSPDGTRIAFLRAPTGAADSAWDLVISGIDGGGVKVLSTTKVSEGDPFSWSPNGSALLLADKDGNLLRFDVAGGAPTVIARNVYIESREAFQPPSGEHILYEPLGGAKDGDPQVLYVMHADGTDQRALYTIPATERQNNCDFGTVRWSPDGSQIAFMRRPKGTEDQCRIFVMNGDGSNARQLTTTPGNWYETDLRWSPDGTQIAFNRWRKTEFDRWNINPIGVVSAAGGEVRGVGSTPVSDGAAFEWSPDGTSIISVAGTALQWPPTVMKEAQPYLIDVKSGSSKQASWSMSSWPSWQRLAP